MENLILRKINLSIFFHISRAIICYYYESIQHESMLCIFDNPICNELFHSLTLQSNNIFSGYCA
uniref:Uncharacterized protein n=1 Tax=Lepeophtheirus salmonis TaxID=72036 RepID=A0A0K2U935_LEPSM